MSTYIYIYIYTYICHHRGGPLKGLYGIAKGLLEGGYWKSRWKISHGLNRVQGRGDLANGK